MTSKIVDARPESGNNTAKAREERVADALVFLLQAIEEKRYGLAFRVLHLLELNAEGLTGEQWQERNVRRGEPLEVACFRQREGETVSPVFLNDKAH